MSTTVENAYCVGVVAQYRGPTNTRGSRWRVWRGDETYASDPEAITVPYDHALSTGADNAGAAILQYLARKSDGWAGAWHVAASGHDCYVAIRVSVEVES